jgi:hypothetical protein
VIALRGADQVIANLANDAARLHRKIMLPGCGHWTQQERPCEVNAAMIDFLRQFAQVRSGERGRISALPASAWSPLRSPVHNRRYDS